MFCRSALLIQLLALFVCVCCAEDAATVTTEKPVNAREGTTLEIAIVLAGILAASTISVVIVLVPTIFYYNYRNKQEIEGAPVMLH